MKKVFFFLFCARNESVSGTDVLNERASTEARCQRRGNVFLQLTESVGIAVVV